jgi:hypothetical protein
MFTAGDGLSSPEMWYTLCSEGVPFVGMQTVMPYITLQQAAQRLGIEEQVLLEWVNRGFLTAYSPAPIQRRSYRTRGKPLLGYYVQIPFARDMTHNLYFNTEDIEEIAEDMAWSKLGRKRLWDEDA